MFVLAHSTQIYTPQTGFPSKAPVARVTRVGPEEILPPCGRFLQQQPQKDFLWALKIHKDGWAPNDTFPQKMSNGKCLKIIENWADFQEDNLNR